MTAPADPRGLGQFGIAGRTSPRQAILVDAAGIRVSLARGGGGPADLWTDELRRLLLLDLLGSVVAVNGATIAVIAESALQARALAALLPPGLDLLVPPAETADRGHLAWAIRLHLDRAFGGVVAVAGDVAALPARTVATALSSLTGADLVAGATGATGGLYLLGVRDDAGLAIALSAGWRDDFAAAGAADLQAAARAAGAVARLVERRPRIARDQDPREVVELLTDLPAKGPRTEAFLRANRAASPERRSAGGPPGAPHFERGLLL